MTQPPLVDFRPFLGCLSNRAFQNQDSKGRIFTKSDQYDSDASYYNVLDAFQLDFGKITDGKRYRSLNYKAQVFCLPDDTYARTRLIHTVEVIRLSRDIAAILGLNVSLCEAIAAGHDIGHVPYGHIGEEFIAKLTGRKFRHNVFSVVVAEEVERKGKGLCLTYEVEEGMYYHSRGRKSLVVTDSLPLEYAVVMYADKIAYTFADINDSINLGRIKAEQLPPVIINMGADQRSRVLNATLALVTESAAEKTVSFVNSEFAQHFEQVRQWMYDEVYHKEERKVFHNALEVVHDFIAHSELFIDCDPVLLLALLTDKDIKYLIDLALVSHRINSADVGNLGISRLVPYLRGRQIDCFSCRFGD